jgi:hypothetical protein
LVSQKIEATKNTSSQLSSALAQIAMAIGSAITSWQTQQALPNCSADVQQQHYDILIKQQIKFMTKDKKIIQMKCHIQTSPTLI